MRASDGEVAYECVAALSGNQQLNHRQHRQSDTRTITEPILIGVKVDEIVLPRPGGLLGSPRDTARKYVAS